MSRLAQVDLGTKLKKSEAKEQLAQAQERLVHLRLLLGGQIGPREIGPPLLVLFEGWDASGKGGAIKRLVDQLDPRHARVAQFAAPTYDEKRHHFLWRFCPAGAAWRCSTAPGTAGCSWSAWRVTPPRTPGDGRTARSSTSRRRWPP